MTRQQHEQQQVMTKDMPRQRTAFGLQNKQDITSF